MELINVVLSQLFYSKYKAATSAISIPSNFKKVKGFKTVNSRLNGSTGIYRNSRDKKDYFIKTLNHPTKNLNYYHFLNEVKFLEYFSRQQRKGLAGFSVPKLIQFEHSKSKSMLITEIIRGKSLKLYPVNQKVKVLRDLLTQLSNYELENENFLGRRSRLTYLISFLFFWFITFVKYPRKTLWLLQLFIKFYWNYLHLNPFTTDWTLSHRDLHPDNIVITPEHKVSLIDWELSVLTDSLYDLSLLPRFYTEQIKQNILAEIIQSQVKNDKDKHKFVSLFIYNCIQTLALDEKYSSSIKNVLAALTNMSDYLPINKNSITTPFEKINGWIMEAISRYKFSRFQTNTKIILCYHSVSESGWRFSTPLKNFEDQITYLKYNFKIMSLSQLLIYTGKETAVAITFDDGYEDILTNALPLLEKLNIPATAFVLGNPSGANRDELDNNLKLLSVKQIKSLYDSGWEIGFHTSTHANLSSLTESEIVKEIRIGKNNLEKKLGINLNYFAYPRGAYTSEVVDQLKNAGFEAAFTVDGGKASLKNKLLISRVPVEGRISLNQFKGQLTPLGLFMTRIFLTGLKYKQRLEDYLSNEK